MSGLLPWLTFTAALIAAVGSVIGPIIAYRAAIRTIQGEQQIARDQLRQDTVDQLIVQATGDNARLSAYALAQLDYLLGAGQLTIEQTTAVRNAIRAVLTRLEPTAAPRIRPADISAVDVQRAGLWIRLDDALGRSTPAYVRHIADAEPADD